MEERGAPLLGKARGTSENLGKETRENEGKSLVLNLKPGFSRKNFPTHSS